MQLSTGLRNYLCATGSMRAALAGKVINIYSGTPPVSADAALGVGNSLLCIVSVNGDGTGITFEAVPVGGVLVKTTAEEWTGTVLETGTATFFRVATSADSQDSSTTAVRLQGTIAVLGADMNISNPALVAAATQDITYFALTQPAQ